MDYGDAPSLTEEELISIRKWVDDLYKVHSKEDLSLQRLQADDLRKNAFRGLFGHPDNIRFLGSLFEVAPPEWWMTKYKNFLDC